MLTPQGDLRYFKQSITGENPFEYCKETINIETKECTIIEKDDKFIMNLVVQDEVSLKCSVKRNESLVIDDGIIFEDTKDNSKRHYWWYPIIDGDFDANIEFSDEKGNSPFQIKGKVYHDHNWGNASIQKYFKGWWWCHQTFTTEDTEGYLIMYSLDSIEKTNDRFVGIISVNQEQIRFNETNTVISTKRDENTFIKSIDVANKEEGISIKIEIKDVLKKREVPVNQRSSAHGELSLNGVNIKSKGLFEELNHHA
jgi:hypothetical protein